MSKALRILLIGKSGRLDAILTALYRSGRDKDLFVLSEVSNPGLVAKAKITKGQTDDRELVKRLASEIRPDFAVIGPEEPLAAGIVDCLRELRIPCVGPVQDLARLESSKSFTRALLSKYGIEGNPEYRVFRTSDGIAEYLRQLGDFVIKPDGLTGGKGVKVSGDHLQTVKEGIDYANALLRESGIVLIEEKLDGEEFSFQSFCDGRHVIDTVPVQDHKRALPGDRGPNTGGMGSYSCEDHLLPFLSTDDIRTASRINRDVARALLEETGTEYKGILYGSFMLTKTGVKIVEYNARFGDPEAMNVLSILKTDFVDICLGIIEETLDRIPVEFTKKATVCKYVVPKGYPDKPVRGEPILLGDNGTGRAQLYYAGVNLEKDGNLLLTGSRAVAYVGVADTLAEAEQIAEKAAASVSGLVVHRHDIGTAALIQKRMDHMRSLKSENRPKAFAGAA
jgi:phosphoribosylamine---glycine ligase